MFLAPTIFWGKPLKILDRHYKIQPSTDHCAKFRADRSMHLEDLALKKTSWVKNKSSQKLSFPGGACSMKAIHFRLIKNELAFKQFQQPSKNCTK